MRQKLALVPETVRRMEKVAGGCLLLQNGVVCRHPGRTLPSAPAIYEGNDLIRTVMLGHAPHLSQPES